MDDTSLLAPISADAPCGPDLEYDPAFLALESELDAGYVDRAVGPEDEGATPDWKRIAEQATALMTRTHDLRVAVLLTKAWLHMHGVTGLARGLLLLQQLLSLRWGSVHPQIGAQGDMDGLMRVNALRSLCDSRSLLVPLRAASLLRARGLPALCLRDLEKALSGASGASDVPGAQSTSDAPDITVVDASFIGCNLDELAETQRTVSAARAATLALEQLFAEHGTPALLRLSELSAQLEAIESQLGPRLRARRAALAVQAEIDAEPPSAADATAPAADSTTPRGQRNAHAPLGREQALRELDRICAYYDEHEPSSPVPMLLRRAKRLAGMPFIELVRELAPGGSAEIETLRGPNSPESAERP